MRVYRIEASCGKGVYQYGSKLNKSGSKIRSQLNRAHCTGDHRPGLWDDFHSQTIESKFKTGTHFFGCPSIEALKEWFDDFLPKFARNRSCSVVSYEAEEAYTGKSGLQVFFKPIPETRQVLKLKDLGLTSKRKSVK